MNKRGIVLLMTLFFIISISALVYKNLDYSDKMLKKANESSILAQLQISSQNVKDEITSILYEKKEEIADILPLENVTINIGNKIDVDIKKIEFYDEKIDINKQELSAGLTSFIKSSDLNITSNKQLNFVLDEYIRIYDDNVIKDEKDSFTYLNIDKTEKNEYIFCSFDVKLDGYKSYVEFIYNNKNKKVVDFEFIFKR